MRRVLGLGARPDRVGLGVGELRAQHLELHRPRLDLHPRRGSSRWCSRERDQRLVEPRLGLARAAPVSSYSSSAAASRLGGGLGPAARAAGLRRGDVLGRRVAPPPRARRRAGAAAAARSAASRAAAVATAGRVFGSASAGEHRRRPARRPGPPTASTRRGPANPTGTQRCWRAASGRQEVGRGGIDLVGVQVHVEEPVALGPGMGELVLGDRAHLHSTPATVAPGLRAARTACSTVGRSAKPSSTITSLRKPSRPAGLRGRRDPLAGGPMDGSGQRAHAPTPAWRAAWAQGSRAADSAGAPDTVARTRILHRPRRRRKAEHLAPEDDGMRRLHCARTMTLRELMGNGAPEVEVSGLAYSSQSVTPGTLFFCVPGFRADGHDFAPEAVERGAVALVCQRPLGLGVPEVVVPGRARRDGPGGGPLPRRPHRRAGRDRDHRHQRQDHHRLPRAPPARGGGPQLRAARHGQARGGRGRGGGGAHHARGDRPPGHLPPDARRGRRAPA